ncbi:hypothetical protein PILCRDRAFT_821794 [Piloderma croceum F 1598]|uniref:Uncharacterized protein n=1 Tax=Piloderma croceum (strain F 1598) TaxID=765440 RepID=A0A0C3B517_PILCF|nr:hypothetical protein PILCRDRAFT_821794 [Piloderma croceum F 1598]
MQYYALVDLGLSKYTAVDTSTTGSWICSLSMRMFCGLSEYPARLVYQPSVSGNHNGSARDRPHRDSLSVTLNDR